MFQVARRSSRRLSRAPEDDELPQKPEPVGLMKNLFLFSALILVSSQSAVVHPLNRIWVGSLARRPVLMYLPLWKKANQKKNYRLGKPRGERSSYPVLSVLE